MKTASIILNIFGCAVLAASTVAANAEKDIVGRWREDLGNVFNDIADPTEREQTKAAYTSVITFKDDGTFYWVFGRMVVFLNFDGKLVQHYIFRGKFSFSDGNHIKVEFDGDRKPITALIVVKDDQMKINAIDGGVEMVRYKRLK